VHEASVFAAINRKENWIICGGTEASTTKLQRKQQQIENKSEYLDGRAEASVSGFGALGTKLQRYSQ
jgi:hypothetical protein